jgi:hypothetical protein
MIGKDAVENTMPMSESDVLQAIENGDLAYELLIDANPKFAKRFDKLCKSMVEYLNDVKFHFPDACYYTASAGFNLMLGRPHDDSGHAQQELIAIGGSHGVSIGDGDF